MQTQLGRNGFCSTTFQVLGLKDEAGNTLVAFFFFFLSVKQAGITDMCIGDPQFTAMQFPVVAFIDGMGIHAGPVPHLATDRGGPMFCILNGRRHDAETLAICSAIKTDSR